MTNTKVKYIAKVNIMTDPPWLAGDEPTPEQLKQIEDIRKYVYLGQVQTKSATKRKTKKDGE